VTTPRNIDVKLKVKQNLAKAAAKGKKGL